MACNLSAVTWYDNDVDWRDGDGDEINYGDGIGDWVGTGQFILRCHSLVRILRKRSDEQH